MILFRRTISWLYRAGKAAMNLLYLPKWRPIIIMVGGGSSFIILRATNTQQPRTFKELIITDYGGDSKWVRDGLEGGALDVSFASTYTITFASATQGTPFNVGLQWNNNPSFKGCYYKVRVTDTSKGALIEVGFVTEYGFRPGWKKRVFSYNRNCTNGSVGPLIRFGKSITVGGVVGVHLMRDDAIRKCIIIFYHNGPMSWGWMLCRWQQRQVLPMSTCKWKHNGFIFIFATTFYVWERNISSWSWWPLQWRLVNWEDFCRPVLSGRLRMNLLASTKEERHK